MATQVEVREGVAARREEILHIYFVEDREPVPGDVAMCGHVKAKRGGDGGWFDSPRSTDCVMCLAEMERF